MKYYTILILTLLFVVACKNKDAEIVKSLSTISSNYGVEIKNSSTVIFLPLDGCNPCNQKVLEYFHEKHDNSGIIWVVTANYSKQVQFYLGEEALQKKNVIFDSLQLSYLNGLMNNLPSVYILEDQKIIY